MNLFEAIVEANHGALAGDDKAGLHLRDVGRHAGYFGSDSLT